MSNNETRGTDNVPNSVLAKSLRIDHHQIKSYTVHLQENTITYNGNNTIKLWFDSTTEDGVSRLKVRLSHYEFDDPLTKPFVVFASRASHYIMLEEQSRVNRVEEILSKLLGLKEYSDETIRSIGFGDDIR